MKELNRIKSFSNGEILESYSVDGQLIAKVKTSTAEITKKVMQSATSFQNIQIDASTATVKSCVSLERNYVKIKK
jgi:hypothetical protein